MDSEYTSVTGAGAAEAVESRLVVAHVDGRVRRAREDFYVIDGRSAPALDHTIVWRWDEGVRKLLLARTRHRRTGAAAPATCIVQPVLEPWPFATLDSVAGDDGASLAFAAGEVGDVAGSDAGAARFGYEETWEARLGMRPSEFETLAVRGFVGLWRPPVDPTEQAAAAVGAGAGGAQSRASGSGDGDPLVDGADGGRDDDSDGYEVAVLLGRRESAANRNDADTDGSTAAWRDAGLEPLLVTVPGQRRNFTIIDFQAGCRSLDEQAHQLSSAWDGGGGADGGGELRERREGSSAGAGDADNTGAMFDVWGWDIDGGECKGMGATPL